MEVVTQRCYLRNYYKCMNFIKSYCRIVPGHVWLNGEAYFKSTRNPFVMNDFFSAIYEHARTDYRKFYKMDALSKLGFLASELLLAGSDREQPKPDMGIVFFNRSSSLAADMNYQKTIQHKEDFYPSPADFVYTLPNIVAGEIAIRNKIYGETVFYTKPNFSGDTVSRIINDAMSASGIKFALTGWIEVDVHNNMVDCLMMLCTPKQGKTLKNSPSLPAGFEGVYAGENIILDAFNILDLYKY